jgi:hypothetical protein
LTDRSREFTLATVVLINSKNTRALAASMAVRHRRPGRRPMKETGG